MANITLSSERGRTFFPQEQNKARVAALISTAQHFTGGPSQSNLARKKKKTRHPNFQGKVNYFQLQVTWDPKGYVTNLLELLFETAKLLRMRPTHNTTVFLYSIKKHHRRNVYGFLLKMATKIILTHMHRHLTRTQTQGLYAL